MKLKQYMMTKRSNKGFTLIELGVVVAIIGILALVSFTSSNSSARDMAEIRNVQSKLNAGIRMYRAKTLTYPATFLQFIVLSGPPNAGNQSVTLEGACPNGKTVTGTGSILNCNYPSVNYRFTYNSATGEITGAAV